jgi:hypothetical protein
MLTSEQVDQVFDEVCGDGFARSEKGNKIHELMRDALMRQQNMDRARLWLRDAIASFLWEEDKEQIAACLESLKSGKRR